jgi:hypothetical protein
MDNLSQNKCACVERLSRAEALLRSKGRARPELAAQYYGAATEFRRVVLEHFSDCPTCQAANVQREAVAA